MTEAKLRGATGLLLVGLIVLSLLWEGWLAPLRPEGSWLILKALPLVAALNGVFRGRRYTFQWLSMVVLLYVAEGSVRAFDPGLTGLLAALEALLAILLFICTLAYCRVTAPSRQGNAG